MYKTTVKIGGMACSMCEAHINDVLRKTLGISKVKSDYRKGQAIITSEEPLDEKDIQTALATIGYEFLGCTKEEVKKRGLFR